MMTEMQKLARRMLEETEVTHPLLGLWRHQVLNDTAVGPLPTMESISPKTWLDYYSTAREWDGYTTATIMEHVGECTQAGFGTKRRAEGELQLTYPQGTPRDSQLIDVAVWTLAVSLQFEGDADLAETVFWFHQQRCNAYAMSSEGA